MKPLRMLVGVALLLDLCGCAQSLIRIREGPQNSVVDVVQGTFHQFVCESSNTSSIPFWSINGTVYDVIVLPIGHRVVEGGLLVFVTGDLNGTSYQCLHVDCATLEPVTSDTAVLKVSEQSNATSTENICRQMIHFHLYNITSDNSGIYLSWDMPECRVALRNYDVYLTHCPGLSNPHSEPLEFDDTNGNSIMIPSHVLRANNLFSVKAFDADGGCCATSGPYYLQTSSHPEDPVPFLVAENDMAENCSAHNLSISIDEALPPGCVDGCCCPAYNSTCVCKLDPFYICKNGSHLFSGEPCNCPTKLCICIRKATIEINNTHLYYEQQQSCCQGNEGCTTVGEVRRVIVGGPPLHPLLINVSRGTTTFSISLKKPFSHFPITNYTLEMTRASGPGPVCNFSEDSNFTCNLEAVSLPLQCPPFQFSLIAYSRVGASKPSEDITKDLNIILDVDPENLTATSAVVDITLPGDFFPINGSGIVLNISLNHDEYPPFNAHFLDKHNNIYHYEVTGLNPETNYTVYPVVPVLRIGGVDGDEEQLSCPFPDSGISFKTGGSNKCADIIIFCVVPPVIGGIFIVIIFIVIFICIIWICHIVRAKTCNRHFNKHPEETKD